MAGTPFATNHANIPTATVIAEPRMIGFACSGSLDHHLHICRSGSDGRDFPVLLEISFLTFLAAFQITNYVSSCTLRDLKVNSLSFHLVQKTPVRSIQGGIRRGRGGNGSRRNSSPSEFDDCLTDSHRCGSIEVVAFAIGHDKRNKPRGNFPLGNDDNMFAFALNACFGPASQLVGSFGRHQDESKLAVHTFWKFHF
jgi:hypothetical protein